MNRLKCVALHITEECSHGCSFCYYRSKRNDLVTGKRHFPLEQLKLVINQVASSNAEELFLLGGDPAEHNDILEIVKHAHDAGLVITSVSNTHNYKCNHELLSRYLSICETTIHAETPEKHDEICGVVGAYDSVLLKLVEFKKYGSSIGITINITSTNYSSLYQIVYNLVNSFGEILDYVNIQRITPMGRAEKSNAALYLTLDMIISALEGIDKIHKELGIEIQCEDAIPLCLLPEQYQKYIHRCEWGYSRVSLNGDGGVSRCGADPRYNLGNIFDTSLQDIWIGSPILKKFRERDFLPQSCLECPSFNVCGGGCVSGAWTGNELNKDILLHNR
ncbi:MAG: radical SAM protein [Oscillospiraceae bacterium]|nr:radical SAM protein [Oscillospiraceae bacterium]